MGTALGGLGRLSFREHGGELKTVEFVEFVLTEFLREEELEQDYTAEEEEKIKKRLQALGYIR